jgi:hypothetical protein
MAMCVAKPVRENLRRDHPCHAEAPCRQDTHGDQAEHVQLPCEERNPAPMQEGPAAP